MAYDLCDNTTNSSEALDNHMRYNHGKCNYDLVSHIKSTTPASQTKLGSSSFSCELCGYKGDMAGQLKKHVESMHIYLLHAIRSAENKSLFSGWMEKRTKWLPSVWMEGRTKWLSTGWMEGRTKWLASGWLEGKTNGCQVNGW